MEKFQLEEEQLAIFQKNIDALIKKQGRLCLEISKYSYDYQLPDYIYELETNENNTALCVRKNEKDYVLNSTYYPKEEAKRWVKQFNEPEDMSVVVVYGFGNGVIPRELIKKGNKVCYIFIEPTKEVFTYVMTHYAIDDILEESKVYIVVPEWNKIDYNALLGEFLNWYNLPLLQINSLPKYSKLYQEECVEFLKKLKELCDGIKINQTTASFFALASVRNQLHNYEAIIKGTTLTACGGKLPEHIPGIIVSAGPSLKNNIEILKKWKGHAFILAVDSALPFLMEHDMIPDAWIIIDGVKPVELFADPRVAELPAIIYADAHWRVTEIAKNSRIFCTTGLTLFNNIMSSYKKDVTQIGSGGSVATSALMVLVYLGFERVILTGQDLAFTGDPAYDDIDHVVIHRHYYPILSVDANGGGTVRTRGDYFHYLKWFENIAEELKDLELINATEGGAFIKGTKVMTLEETLNEYGNQDVDCEKILSNLKPTFTEKQQNKILDHWSDKISNNLSKMKKQASRGYELCNKFIKILDKKNYQDKDLIAVIDKLNKIEKSITKQAEYQLVESYMASVISKTTANLYQKNEDLVLDQKIVTMRLRYNYDAIRDACDRIQDIMKLDGLIEFEKSEE